VNEADISQQSQELLAQSEALIEEAEKALREGEELYARHGVSRADLDKFIEVGMAHLTPQQKAEIERNEIEWQREIDEILKPQQSSLPPKVRPGMVRI